MAQMFHKIDSRAFCTEFRKALISIPIYRRCSVEVSVQAITTSEIRPLVHSVLEDRLNSAIDLVKKFSHHDLPPFVPIAVRRAKGWSIIAPPIIERTTQSYVMDGSHRCLAARRLGISNTISVLVSGEGLTQPASDPYEWDSVTIAKKVRHWTERVSGLRMNEFRPVVNISQLVSSIVLKSPHDWRSAMRETCQKLGR